MRRFLLPLTLLALLATTALPASSTSLTDPRADGDLQWVEVFAEDGGISWTQVRLPDAELTAADAEVLSESGVTPLHQTGPSANRFDLVIVGDGYTADEISLFHEHAQDKVDAILAEEPFTSYAGMFNIWAVDVISSESGVDNDPYPGLDVDTALDMEFWCSGIERLLCVNQSAARAAANAAPEVDHVLVLANSDKYGGAGGSVATSSGGNGAASLVTIHELGHSIGGLADEYEYYARAGLSEDSTEDVTIPAPGLGGLPGREPGGANITAASSPEEMADEQLKWFRWLGEESPDGGVVGTYEGGGYSPVFIYRATEDSLMHTLGIAKGGNRFNVVGIEEMTAAFHSSVDIVTDASAAATPSGPQTITIEVEDFGPAPFTISWAIDGEFVPGWAGLREVTVDAPGSVLTVTVADPTAFVRNPDLIEDDLTEVLSWQL